MTMKKLNKFLGGLRSMITHRNNLENSQLAGIRLLTHKGTIRKKADQDGMSDIWTITFTQKICIIQMCSRQKFWKN